MRLSKKEYKKYTEFLAQKYPICQICDKQRTIEFHHLLFGCYGADKDDTSLIAVCRKCHQWCHQNKHKSQEKYLEIAKRNWGDTITMPPIIDLSHKFTSRGGLQMLENQKTPELVRDLGMLYPKKTSKEKTHYGIYKCPFCGKEFKARAGNIRNKNTQSCGCYKIKTHTTHGLYYHPIYSIWKSMIQRTQNSKCKSYKNYGGRGITVCDRWQKIENFIEDMYLTYKEGLTIDRIDNNGNYDLNNCRWATKTVQARNTRKLQSNNTSGYRGVCWDNNKKKWVASIKVNNRRIHIGYFISILKAALAYDSYIISHNLEHTLNFTKDNK